MTSRQLAVVSALAAIAFAPLDCIAQGETESADEPRPVTGDVVPPVLLTKIEPEYSWLARKKHVTGQVVLQAVITERGDVSDVWEENRSNPLLNSEAIAAVKQWKYEPATLHGRPVSVSITVVVDFTLDSAGDLVVVDRDGALADFGDQRIVLLPRSATLERPRPGLAPEILGEVTLRALVEHEGRPLYRVSLDGRIAAQVGDRVVVVDGPSSPAPVEKERQADTERVVEMLRAIWPPPSPSPVESMLDSIRQRRPTVSDSVWNDVTGDITLDDMFRGIAPVIQQRMTRDEVESAVTFFRSDAGRRLIEVVRRYDLDIDAAEGNWFDSAKKRIEERLRARGYAREDD